MASWLARLSAGGVMRSAPSACSRARVGMVAGWELEPVRSVPSVVLDRDSEAGANLRSAEIVELNAGCSLRSTHNRKPSGHGSVSVTAGGMLCSGRAARTR